MERDYKLELEEARKTLQRMLMDYDVVLRNIAKQKQIVAALTQLAELTTPNDLVEGVTDAVRTVLRSAGMALGTAEIYLRARGLGLPSQQNLLASITTTLRRLKEAGEIEFVGDRDTGGYRLKTPPIVRVSRLGYNRLPGKAKKDPQ